MNADEQANIDPAGNVALARYKFRSISFILQSLYSFNRFFPMYRFNGMLKALGIIIPVFADETDKQFNTVGSQIKKSKRAVRHLKPLVPSRLVSFVWIVIMN